MLNYFTPISIRHKFKLYPKSLSACVAGLLVACGSEPAFKEETVRYQNSAERMRGPQVGSGDAEANAGEKPSPNRDFNEDGSPVAFAQGATAEEAATREPLEELLKKAENIAGSLTSTQNSAANGDTQISAQSQTTETIRSQSNTTTSQPDTPVVARPGAPVNYSTHQQKGKVDILWAIDSSGSMGWAQKRLGEKFQSFAAKLSQANVDFQLGITTLDVCDIDWSTGESKPDTLCPTKEGGGSGRVVNNLMVGPAQGRLIADPQTGKTIFTQDSNFVESFVRTAKVGTSGSGFEHGLTAAKLAILRALDDDKGSFIRKDAFLSVIVLSDEEDDGVQFWCEDGFGNTSLTALGTKDLQKCKKGGGSPYLDAFGALPFALTVNPATGRAYSDYKFTAQDFKSFVEDPKIKGPGKTRVSTITGIRDANGKLACNPEDLDGGTGPKEAGTNYIAAAELTRGHVENICSKNWDKLLENIGNNVGQLANQIPLPKGKIPFSGSIKVWVNGSQLSSDAFSYNQNGNFLIFNVAPPSGAEIEISYLETIY